MPLAALGPIAAGTPRFARELARAERLFAERRYAPAREAFERLAAVAAGDEAELVQLRMAESDYFLKRYQPGPRGPVAVPRPGGPPCRGAVLLPHDDAARREPRRVHRADAGARRRLPGQLVGRGRAQQPRLVPHRRTTKTIRPTSSSGSSSRDFRPADTPRARMWKVGWWAYRQKQLRRSGRGVRSRRRRSFPAIGLPAVVPLLGREGTGAGRRRHRRRTRDSSWSYTDYANSFYGRLAAKALESSGTAVPAAPASCPRRRPRATPRAPTADLIRWLIFVEMYDEALDEVQYAERACGTSAPLAATRAWLLNRTGELRPGINLMRRTYPQFLAAGGESMPPEILAVIFPLRLLAAHQPARRGAQARPVPGRGARSPRNRRSTRTSCRRRRPSG